MATQDMTCIEVADELEITEATVRRYIHSGLLRAYKVGPMWLICPKSVERLCDLMLDAEDEDEYEDEDDDDDEENDEHDDEEIDEDDDDEDDLRERRRARSERHRRVVTRACAESQDEELDEAEDEHDDED